MSDMKPAKLLVSVPLLLGSDVCARMTLQGIELGLVTAALQWSKRWIRPGQ
jgi:hypothetical protein